MTQQQHQEQQQQQQPKKKRENENDDHEDNDRTSTSSTTSSNLYFKGFHKCEIFERLFHRSEYLELWRELAIRPSTMNECDPDDIDLFHRQDDDYNALVKRCNSTRQKMNINLPPIETVIDDDLYPQKSHIPNAGLGLFYIPSNQQQQQQQQPEDDYDDDVEDNSDNNASRQAKEEQEGKEEKTEDESKTKNMKFIPEGTTICYYTGYIHNFQSARSLKDKSYLMALVGKRNYLVDPQPTPNIKARYINDPLNTSLINCKFVPHYELPRAAVIATRNIYEGEELFVSYGDLYWNQQSSKGNILYTT